MPKFSMEIKISMKQVVEFPFDETWNFSGDSIFKMLHYDT